MAEILNEFDEPCIANNLYCTQLSVEEYEDQTITETDRAIKDLIRHLEQNPQEYTEVLKKKRKQDAEDAGWLSYTKVKLFSFFGEEMGYQTPTKDECSQELKKLKEDMISVHKYSSQGRRCSARLAERRAKGDNIVTKLSFPKTEEAVGPSLPPGPPPPAPPPPPIPPSSVSGACPSSLVTSHLTRRSLNHHMKLRSANTNKPKKESIPSHHDDLIKQISGNNLRKRLKQTGENRSPGGTPIGGWKKRKVASNNQQDTTISTYFNLKLFEKFKNIRSPTPNSPSSIFETP